MEVVAVLLYFIIGIVSAGLLIRATLLDDDDAPEIWVVVFAWPFVLECALVVSVFYYVYLAVRYVGGK